MEQTAINSLQTIAIFLQVIVLAYTAKYVRDYTEATNNLHESTKEQTDIMVRPMLHVTAEFSRSEHNSLDMDTKNELVYKLGFNIKNISSNTALNIKVDDIYVNDIEYIQQKEIIPTLVPGEQREITIERINENGKAIVGGASGNPIIKKEDSVLKKRRRRFTDIDYLKYGIKFMEPHFLDNVNFILKFQNVILQNMFLEGVIKDNIFRPVEYNKEET